MKRGGPRIFLKGEGVGGRRNLRPFIHGERTNTRAVQLITVNRCCAHVWLFFLGWVMLLHSQATSKDHGGPRTSDLSIERRRRNHFTAAPLKFHKTIKNFTLPFFRPILILSTILISRALPEQNKDRILTKLSRPQSNLEEKKTTR